MLTRGDVLKGWQIRNYVFENIRVLLVGAAGEDIRQYLAAVSTKPDVFEYINPGQG
jgi:hypothetical protein